MKNFNEFSVMPGSGVGSKPRKEFVTFREAPHHGKMKHRKTARKCKSSAYTMHKVKKYDALLKHVDNCNYAISCEL